MLYSETNEKIMNSLLELENYYYTNTEKGLRESSLFLNYDYIELDNHFPLYDCGLRKLEHDTEHDIYILNVDVLFLSSELYSYISFIKESFSFFVRVISNENNIKDIEFNYSENLFFEIKIYNFICILNSGVLFIDSDEIDYLMDKGIKFKAINDEYRVIKYFDGSVINYDKLANKFNLLFANSDYTEIHFRLCGDYQNSLDLLKEIFLKLTWNKNITLIFFFECFSTDTINKEVLKDYDSLYWINFNDLSPFRKYKYKFHYLSFEYILLK